MFQRTKGHFERAAKAIAAGVAFVAFVGTAWAPSTPAVAAIDGHRVYGADAAEQADFAEAVAQFAKAGLPLPPLRVYFHDSAEPCNDHMGLFSKGGDKHRVDICDAYQELIRHELAHAWEHHNMAAATRQAFLDRIGVDEWNRQETPTRSRAIERAADLIVWGIDARPIQLMHANLYAEDLATYELLTGEPSPRIGHWDDATSRHATAGRPSIINIEIVPTVVFE